MDGGSVGRSYTKGRRQPYLIRKWPGSNWALPLGPYTITQLVTFVASVYLLLVYRDVWAHFGPFNLVIGIGIPLLLTYLTRHTRIEGRDPLRAAVALASLLLQPSTGYVRGGPVKTRRPVRQRGGRFPVAALPQPAGLSYPAAPLEMTGTATLPERAGTGTLPEGADASTTPETASTVELPRLVGTSGQADTYPRTYLPRHPGRPPPAPEPAPARPRTGRWLAELIEEAKKQE